MTHSNITLGLKNSRVLLSVLLPCVSTKRDNLIARVPAVENKQLEMNFNESVVSVLTYIQTYNLI